MRKYVILTILAVFLLVSAWVLLNSLSPFDEEKLQLLIAIEGINTKDGLVAVIQELGDRGILVDYLNHRHIILISSLLLLAVGIIFTLAHLLLDRFWWRKFYQQPSLANAVRRAALLDVAIVSVIFYRLYAAPWYLAYLTFLLILIVEVLVSKFLERPRETASTNLESLVSEHN